MTHKEALKRALKELVEARHNLRNGLKNGVPPAQESALWEKVEYRELVVEELRHPSHIDREAWEPCRKCKSCGNCQHAGDYDPYEGYFGDCESCDVKTHSNFSPVKFCHECGRPLTEEAWAMLEKKLNGGDHGKD